MRKKTIEELTLMEVEEFKSKKKLPLILVLDNIRSMNNVGAIFRTADIFRVEEILLVGITATPPHREIQKTALGATESVDWQHFPSRDEALAYLRDREVQLCSLEQTHGAVAPEEVAWDERTQYALVLGNEVEGVHNFWIEASQLCIEIPQAGTKHSLNVSVSTGILLYEAFKKLNHLLD
ncbi:MAG: TrmH family RNA methyltransferase [Cyclobacteriaceae bacterium]|nr:TrmH family RNA methyltransferase [Cyclobacteriaceae bacterium]MCH8515874.1 TrmH family RNA methyltransferase [Cyclobacteriaceae bacterium]